MVTWQRTQINQIPYLLTRKFLTRYKPPSHQHQNLSTQVSQDNKKSKVEHTSKDQNSDSNNSINLSSWSILRNCNPTTTTNSYNAEAIFHKHIDFRWTKTWTFWYLFQTMLKMQPKTTKAMKSNNFHTPLRKEALDDVLNVFLQNYVKPEWQAPAEHKWHKLTFDLNTN